MTEKAEKPRISGKEATHVAMEAQEYGPVRICAADDSTPHSNEPADKAQVPAQMNGTPDGGHARKAPPRVRKPSPLHDQYLAPTPDLEGYRARLREAFGNTMSDEFVDVMLGKVVEALKPSPFDKLEEPTFNAALAIINSVQCRSELEALIAVRDRRDRVLGTSVSAPKPQEHDRGVRQRVWQLRQQAAEASARSDPSPRPTSARSQADR